MKIAIYGVSRSGKDYLIKNIISSEIEGYHLEGSSTLKKLSLNKLGCNFDETTKEQREFLRKEFVKLINDKEVEYGNVFVDGHFSFINDDNYRVVFTEEDKAAYDLFVYLDTPSKMIVEFSRKSTGSKNNMKITTEEVRRWKEFEKQNLYTICDDLNKELIILDEDTTSCVEFFKEYIRTDNLIYAKSPTRTAEILLEDIKIDKQKILLLDCDKTISENDVTYDFCNYLGVNTAELKSIFRNDRYTSYQFFKLNNLYKKYSQEQLDIAANVVLDKLNVNKSMMELIYNSSDFVSVGITSGLYQVWSKKVEEENLLDNIIGCKVYNDNALLVTPYVKRAVARELKNRGYHVVSVGDSIIDIPMLEESGNGFIVAHQKINKAVKNYFCKTDSEIKQFIFSNFSYPNIQKVGEII